MNNKIIHAVDYLKHDRGQFMDSIISHCFKWLPDKPYLSLRFRYKMGYWMDFKNPKTFNEKLQWLKLHDRKPEYTSMVDKAAAKQVIADKIGEEYIIPTLGLWDNPEDIEWDKLPNQFVLKTTHGGGGTGIVICKDKSSIDKQKALQRLKASLKTDIYHSFREWPYKNVPKRIIAEEYLEDESGSLNDYKFYCFDGLAYCVMLCEDRAIGDTKFYYFDREWNFLRLDKRCMTMPEDFTIIKPNGMDEMFRLANVLSNGIPSVRVDLFNVKGKIYFGEMTFFSGGGFDKDILRETDELFGKLIDINTTC